MNENTALKVEKYTLVSKTKAECSFIQVSSTNLPWPNFDRAIPVWESAVRRGHEAS